MGERWQIPFLEGSRFLASELLEASVSVSNVSVEVGKVLEGVGFRDGIARELVEAEAVKVFVGGRRRQNTARTKSFRCLGSRPLDLLQSEQEMVRDVKDALADQRIDGLQNISVVVLVGSEFRDTFASLFSIEGTLVVREEISDGSGLGGISVLKIEIAQMLSQNVGSIHFLRSVFPGSGSRVLRRGNVELVENAFREEDFGVFGKNQDNAFNLKAETIMLKDIGINLQAQGTIAMTGELRPVVKGSVVGLGE